nr:G-box-binding factor-like [Lytechinus pictus]
MERYRSSMTNQIPPPPPGPPQLSQHLHYTQLQPHQYPQQQHQQHQHPNHQHRNQQQHQQHHPKQQQSVSDIICSAHQVLPTTSERDLGDNISSLSTLLETSSTSGQMASSTSGQMTPRDLNTPTMSGADTQDSQSQEESPVETGARVDISSKEHDCPTDTDRTAEAGTRRKKRLYSEVAATSNSKETSTLD